ncbi:MAG: hypothetical protein H6658_00435 [Ardenticatenaceae bacterium]|nr:hypothetical protein [Ardenticatenaceae bacterium]
MILNTLPIPLAERFSIELHPAVLEEPGICEIVINNEGIERTNYTISGSDPVGILTLSDEEERQKVVLPGDATRIHLHVAPKKRPFLGRTQNHTFTVQVSTSEQNTQTVTGKITVKPLLPLWVSSIFCFLSLMVIILH